jgi:predicted dehydrogenase
MALVGGSGGGFIGRVHAIAATLDQRAELVAGAFSSDPEKSQFAAAEFGVAPQRGYGSYRELIEAESRLPADQRPDFVTVATPNHTHYEIAAAALQAGFHVVCEKPMTIDAEHALQLARLVEQTGAVFVLAHGYSGYPLVRQAREMIAAGEFGQIHAVRVSYMQGGLWGIQPGQPPTRGAWKADPAKAGPSGAMADIGTHAFHLLRFTTDLTPLEISATLANVHPARPLDDYGHALIRCDGGALATISVSQVTHGRLNDLTLEVDGSRASLVWRQEDPDRLTVRRHSPPVQVYERNRRMAYSGAVQAACRLPGGHPEGVLEAFANVYRDGFDAIVRRAAGQRVELRRTTYPNVYDGLEGVWFVQQSVASHRDHGGWKALSAAG